LNTPQLPKQSAPAVFVGGPTSGTFRPEFYRALQGVISSLVQAIELATGNSSQIDAVLQQIQVLQAELGTLFSSNGNGFLARNNGNFSLHTITGQAGNVTVLNGNGAGGDPLINLATVMQANTGTLRAITLDTFGRVVGNRDATITGTTARITVTNGNASAGVPTIDIASTYIGQTSITTLGTITTGIWNGTVITAPFGGTGQSSYVVGDLLYASATNALNRLADVATGNVLRSGGVGVAPAWGKVSLTTDISGTLPIANGGTGQTTSSTAFDALAPTTTSQDLIVRGASSNGRLAVGSNGNVLTVVGGNVTWAAPAASGSVNSVGLSAPSQFTVTGSPITTSGTLTFAWNAQATNTVLAGPSSGSSAAPTFRSLVSADIPALDFAKITTGVVPISQGGTGQTTANAAYNALSPMTTNGDIEFRSGGVATRLGIGASGQVLTVVSGAPAWSIPTLDVATLWMVA